MQNEMLLAASCQGSSSPAQALGHHWPRAAVPGLSPHHTLAEYLQITRGKGRFTVPGHCPPVLPLDAESHRQLYPCSVEHDIINLK